MQDTPATEAAAQQEPVQHVSLIMRVIQVFLKIQIPSLFNL